MYSDRRIGIYERGTSSYIYELKDHLGNVRATIRKNGANAEVLSYTDYYPHGGALPGRNYIAANAYRFAYQGQEKDVETGLLNFELRMLDTRLGRWFAPDPYGQYYSPYLAMGNDPVNMIDPDGGWADDNGEANGWVRDWFNGEGGIAPGDWIPKDGYGSHGSIGADGTFTSNYTWGAMASEGWAESHPVKVTVLEYVPATTKEPEHYIASTQLIVTYDPMMEFLMGRSFAEQAMMNRDGLGPDGSMAPVNVYTQGSTDHTNTSMGWVTGDFEEGKWVAPTWAFFRSDILASVYYMPALGSTEGGWYVHVAGSAETGFSMGKFAPTARAELIVNGVSQGAQLFKFEPAILSAPTLDMGAKINLGGVTMRLPSTGSVELRISVSFGYFLDDGRYIAPVYHPLLNPTTIKHTYNQTLYTQ